MVETIKGSVSKRVNPPIRDAGFAPRIAGVFGPARARRVDRSRCAGVAIALG
jgi:hypothetical protein